MKLPVVILGCGPAGLFAAQAAQDMGYEVVIMSKKAKSIIYGAQFLHQAIPGLTSREPDGEVTVVKIGNGQGYAKRVYGDPETPTSWTLIDETALPAWELQRAYDRAWDKFEPLITDIVLDAAEVQGMTAYFPIVISTIPLWSICYGKHMFSSVNIHVARRSFGRDVNTVVARRQLPDNYIIYNGDFAYKGWYRTSVIFGHGATEVACSETPRHSIFEDSQVGFKVEGHDCDCHPNLHKVGRMGTWKRGVLTHHAYNDTIAACAGDMVQT